MVKKGIVDESFYRTQNDHFYELYKQSKLDIMEYLAFALKPLTRFSLDELSTLHAEFMHTVIAPMRLPKADALLQHHRQQGDYLLIITATNGFVTQPIAKALGVDDILATDPISGVMGVGMFACDGSTAADFLTSERASLARISRDATRASFSLIRRIGSFSRSGMSLRACLSFSYCRRTSSRTTA